ncbi:MAG: hypothetical protein MUC36_03420 [Planctomycetes bacterium]|jgi:uncharacterized protein involved in exopolysaccharide biosynthesis|nr:hypothetical protein [Planctomycetota bacterium]
MTKNLADELQRTARQALVGMQPIAQGEEAGGLPFRRLLAAAFRARYLVFATTLFGVLVGTFLAITTANTYVSEGKFLFTSAGAEKTVVDSTGAAENSQEAIATGASYVLESDDLLRKVVDRLGPQRILQPYQPGTPDDSGPKALFFRIQRDWNATKESDCTPEEAQKRLKRTIAVERPRNTGVLLARCTANNAELARDILAAFMDEAVKWHIEKYDDQKAYEVAKKSYEDNQVARDIANRALHDFLLNKAKVAKFDEEKARLEKAEVEASIERDKVMREIEVKRGNLARLQQALDVDKSIPTTIRVRQRLDTTASVRTTLEGELAKITSELVRLEGSGDRDERRKNELERTIRGLKTQIASLLKEAADAPEVEASMLNPEFQKAVESRGVLQTDIAGLETTLNYTGQQAAKKREELAKLLDLEPEFIRLRDSKSAADKAVETSEVTWEQAQRKRLLGLGNFSSLKPFQDASLPLEKEGPNRGKLLLGGLMVGLFLGLGILVLRTLPDSVVRTREDLEQVEGLAVIGVMPRLDGKNLKRHEALREQGW